MKALVYTASKTYEIQERPMPEIKDGDDVLVKIEAVSICGTDVHILTEEDGAGMATPGQILGHEACGTVVETGSKVTTLKPGDRVVFDPVLPCGECFFCRAGQMTICPDSAIRGCFGADGFFAQYAVVKSKELIKTSPSLPFEMSVFSEPVNCVMGAMDKIRLTPGENALVLGAGPIGLYFMQLLKKNGAGKVIISEMSEYRKEYAKKLGADVIIDPSKQDLIEEVKKETGGIGADVVVDAVGCLIEDCLKSVRPAGRVMLFGQNWTARETLCQNDITQKNLTVYGNFCGNFTFNTAVRLIESGLIDFTKMITHKIKLEDIEIGLDAMKKGEALEVVVYPNAE